MFEEHLVIIEQIICGQSLLGKAYLYLEVDDKLMKKKSLPLTRRSSMLEGGTYLGVASRD